MSAEIDPSARVASASHVTKVFGKGAAARKALDDLSIDVDAREFVTILGPSGSGKSTLLAILGGLDRAFEGEVTIRGRALKSLSDAALSRLRGDEIGFVFQAFHLLGHVSVLDNVLAPSLFGGADAKSLRPRAVELLERVGLEDRASSLPAELSGGQRQRVAIARALLKRPKLVLCDEPTGNLDQATGARIVDLFEQLHREGDLAIVAVTHETRLASVATRTLHVADGRIAREETRP